MRVILCLCELLIIIGGLNWGLVGFCHFNLIEFITGSHTAIANIIYSLVGLSSLIIIILAIKGECLCFPRCRCGDKCKCNEDEENAEAEIDVIEVEKK